MGWARRLRVASAITVLAFAASCVQSNPVVGPTITNAPGTPTGRASVSPRTTTNAARPKASPGKTNPGSVPAPAYDDDGSVGTMARTYLRSAPATGLVVEVDYTEGREPSRSALDHLRAVLGRELDKPAGIEVRVGNRMSSSRSSWTIADLVALERANRAAHSGGSRAAMWIGYVAGSYAPNENALAVTFSASSAVIFRDRIGDATSSLVLEPAIERSVVLHEVGHILALVNIGYRSRYAHEDGAHPNHSNNPESVMYWAVEDVSVANLLRGGPPDDFDEADRADLAMLRAG